MRHRLRRRTPALLLLVAAMPGAVALAGCQAGPQDLQAGRYVLMAASTPSLLGGVALEVGPSSVTLTQASGTFTSPMGGAGNETVLCPPSGSGSPIRLEGPMQVGDLTLTSPAVHGDCGQTTPRRVTLVDLDSLDPRLRTGFTRWAEFCAATESDCPPVAAGLRAGL